MAKRPVAKIGSPEKPSNRYATTAAVARLRPSSATKIGIASVCRVTGTPNGPGTWIFAEIAMSSEPARTRPARRAKTAAGERVRTGTMDVLYSLAL